VPGRERDITLDVTIRARTADADKAAAALKRVDERAAGAGKSMEGMTGDAKILNAEIAKSEQTIKDLDKVLLEFGNDKSVRQRLRSERSWLADLRKLEKDIAEPAGVVVGDAFGKQFLSSVKGLPVAPILIGALVGAAVAAAPTVGAIIGGGLAGAAGTGAMAIGILSAAKDERVQSAAREAGHNIATMFFGGGEPFVQPVIDSLDILERGFADLHLGDALAKAAPTVTVIAQGLADAGKAFMPGFNKFLDRIGPLAATAAVGIEDMGQALGEFLDDVSASKGTVEGLETLFNLVNGTIRGLGNSLSWLGDRFHEWNTMQASFYGDLEDVAGALGLDDLQTLSSKLNDIFERMTGTGESLHGMFRKLGTEAVDPFAGYLHHAWSEMERLQQETEATRKSLVDYFDTLQGQLDANLAWEQAIDDLTESVLENGRSLDITTEKGRNNIRAVEDGLSAARRQYDQGQLTTAQYDEQIKKLIDIGVKAGLSRQQLEALAKPYQIEILVKMIGPSVTSGVGTFLSNAAAKLTAAVFGSGSSYTGRGEFRASGGPVQAGRMYMVGEQGPEPFIPSTNGTILPNSSLSSVGSSNVVISFAATGDALLDAILRELKKYIRVNGGTGSDSVQTALGY
jgi:hypothetical protein